MNIVTAEQNFKITEAVRRSKIEESITELIKSAVQKGIFWCEYWTSYPDYSTDPVIEELRNKGYNVSCELYDPKLHGTMFNQYRCVFVITWGGNK